MFWMSLWLGFFAVVAVVAVLYYTYLIAIYNNQIDIYNYVNHRTIFA